MKIYTPLIRFSKFFSRKNMKKYLTEEIKSNKFKNKHIVSFGAGWQIKYVLESNNIKFTEVDINPIRNPDVVADIEDLNMFSDNSVDIIFCIEVLEHVVNPTKAISEMNRILKPNGIIIGSTPFMMPIHDEPDDFYRFTKYGLIKLFNSMKLIKIKERNSYLESIFVVLVRLFNIGTLKQRIVSIFLLPFMLVCLLFLYLFRYFIDNKQSTTGYFFVFKKVKK